MNVFALGDLHLSFEQRVIPGDWDSVKEYKPMDIFGDEWNQHYKKIYKNWFKVVGNQDLVLVPGDISWATDLEETEFDFEYIERLPGKKILLKGNHDYWWQGIGKVRSALPANTYSIQNDSLNFEKVSIAGTRGWTAPNSFQFSEHDEKVFRRELIRLELSLKSVEDYNNVLIVMLHYMPTDESHSKNELIELLVDYNVDICVYGHLHGDEAHQNRLTGTRWGIDFHLVSADFLHFQPQLIFSF